MWHYPVIKLSKLITQTHVLSDNGRIYTDIKQHIQFQFNESSVDVGQWSVVSPTKW